MVALIADLTITIVTVFCDVFFFRKMNTFCHALFSITLIQSSLFSLSREARQIYWL